MFVHIYLHIVVSLCWASAKVLKTGCVIVAEAVTYPSGAVAESDFRIMKILVFSAVHQKLF